MKKTIIVLLLVLAAVGTGFYAFNRYQNQVKNELDVLSAEKPELVSYINDLKKASEDLKNKASLSNYLRLGFAWKSLADQTRDLSHYEKALRVYETAVEITERKNTLPLINAGNMAIYLKDFQLAKQYYEEAVMVAPGDLETYQRLIDLHITYLKSPKSEVVEIFDRGISKLINPDPLIKWRESYLQLVK